MADENITGSTAEASATDTVTQTAKKQRAKRQPRVAVEAVPVSPATTVKSTRAYRKKSAEPTAQVTEPVVATGKRSKNDSTKSIAKGKAAVKASPVNSTAVEEMADLIQLEEENQSLRKALSEKLRAENADLRKRLGLK